MIIQLLILQKKIQPSDRGEYEITDINKAYLNKKIRSKTSW